MIAIHQSDNSFSENWIKYCDVNSISYKLVNCYSSNIIENLKGCNVLMWHHSQSNPKDLLFAKELLFALQHSGIKVFPDFKTSWHFDDKVGQKYLLESLNLSLVPSYVFYSKEDALNWVSKTSFPKVFKLRGGAGSANVQLVNDKSQAIRLIKKAFGKGFSQYDAFSNLKERFRKFKHGKASFEDIVKGFIRIVYPPEYAKVMGRAKGYIYFQDFIPGNDYDIRVIIIDNKAFAIKRMNRENDFRASGSGNILYESSHFDLKVVKNAFEAAVKIKSQCLVLDYVFQNGEPLIVEISYGFTKEPYYKCPGYWDRNLNWHEESFNAQGWMIDLVLK